MTDDLEQDPDDQAGAVAQEYLADTQDERRRVFALAVVVQHSEPIRLAPEEFVPMAHRVAVWLRDGVDAVKPAPLSAIEGGKKK